MTYLTSITLLWIDLKISYDCKYYTQNIVHTHISELIQNYRTIANITNKIYVFDQISTHKPQNSMDYLQGIGTLSHSTPYKWRVNSRLLTNGIGFRVRYVNKMRKRQRNEDDRFALLITVKRGIVHERGSVKLQIMNNFNFCRINSRNVNYSISATK